MSIEGWILVLGFFFGFFAGVRDILADYRELAWGDFA
jgi:hypothetical protein